MFFMRNASGSMPNSRASAFIAISSPTEPSAWPGARKAAMAAVFTKAEVSRVRTLGQA